MARKLLLLISNKLVSLQLKKKTVGKKVKNGKNVNQVLQSVRILAHA